MWWDIYRHSDRCKMFKELIHVPGVLHASSSTVKVTVIFPLDEDTVMNLVYDDWMRTQLGNKVKWDSKYNCTKREMCSGKKKGFCLISKFNSSVLWKFTLHTLLTNDVQSVINSGNLHVVCIYSIICIIESWSQPLWLTLVTAPPY